MRLEWKAALAAAALLSACGPTPAGNDGGADAGSDAGEVDAGQGDAGFDGGNVDHGAPSSTYPAYTIDWPRLVGSDAGIMPTPRFVVVTYDGDTHRSALESFAANLGGTTYWTKTTAEYGVGAPTVASPVHLAQTAPALINDSDIQTFLTQQLDGTHPEWPAPDGSTLYLLYYPATTTITIATGVSSCQAFGAYHSALILNGIVVPYAVMPRCPANPNIPAMNTELGVLTGVTSHEILEAVTDIYPGVIPGYRLPDDDHIAFATFAGAENGDMCQFNPEAFIVDTQLNATVQRTWSNVEAQAGREPCVPAPAGPYFTAVPVLNDTVKIDFFGAALTTKGLKLAQGESKTLQLLLVSSADTGGPFTLTAKSRQEFFGQGKPLTFSFDRNQGVNGEKVYLTVTRTGNDPNFGTAIPFAVIASQGTTKTYWFSVVGSQ